MPMNSSSLQVDQGAEHRISGFHDLCRQSNLMTTGHLFDGIGGKNLRISGIHGNAAAGKIDPLHAGPDTLKAHG